MIQYSSTYIAKIIINAGCVEYSDENLFTLASGDKSNIYIDCRKLWSDVIARKLITNEMMNRLYYSYIKREYKTPDVIIGIATGGIPIGMLLADAMGMPFIYYRKDNKLHGINENIVGCKKKFEYPIIVEDTITTGGTVLTAIDYLKDNFNINDMILLSIVDRSNNEVKDTINNVCPKWKSLTTLECIYSKYKKRID